MVFDCVDLPEVIIKDQPYLPPPAHITKTYYEGQPTSRLSSEQLHCYRPSTRQSLTFDPIPTYIERSPRSNRSPKCSRSPIRNRSRCSTPSYLDRLDRPSTPCTLSSRPQLCFTSEIPISIEKSRPGSRYKSLVCTKRGEEDVIYNDKYDKYELRERERDRERFERDIMRERELRDRDRQYATYNKSYQPVVYENLEKTSLSKNNNQDFELAPNERVYEIRKEKLLIKADRNSQSPPRSRARSSDRYLDAIPTSKSSRIIDDNGNQIIVPTDKYIYTTNSDSKRQLQSRSGYYITNDYNKLEDDLIDYNNNNNNNNRFTNDQIIDKRLMYAAAAAAASNNNLNKKYESSNPNLTSYSNILPNNNSHNSNNNSSSNSSSNNIAKQQSSPSPQSQPPSSIVNVVSPSNEIVYVPMVKDEFIKRESQKMDCSGTNSNSANNNNNFRRF
jgi:hypothetical protein